MDGVFETVVGYSGGTSSNPTYHRIGDHMETLQISFDPGIVSYDALLRIFWMEHDHTRQPWSRQYMNAVFYHSDEQKEKIIKSMDSLPGKVRTELIPYSRFYAAEDYHQKFYLQRHPEITKEYLEAFPSFNGFVASAAVARVNGILGGYGSRDWFEEIVDLLGLSRKAEDFLRSRLVQRKQSFLSPAGNL
jgi:methionine-S-sulfoxide reductase